MIGVDGALGTRRFRGLAGGRMVELTADRCGDVRRAKAAPRVALLPLMAKAPARPACAGMYEVFDSTEPDVIVQALAVCAGCPVLDWCRTEARHAVTAKLPITGTWGGVAYADGTALGTGVTAGV